MSPKTPTEKRLTEELARTFIDGMERAGYVRIPYRRWTRRFKKEGVPVVHGPISVTRTGNWAPRPFVESLRENRRHPEFRAMPFHRQVEEVAWRVMWEKAVWGPMHGNHPQPPQAP